MPVIVQDVDGPGVKRFVDRIVSGRVIVAGDWYDDETGVLVGALNGYPRIVEFCVWETAQKMEAEARRESILAKETDFALPHLPRTHEDRLEFVHSFDYGSLTEDQLGVVVMTLLSMQPRSD